MNNLNFDELPQSTDVNAQWNTLKTSILNIIDSIAPIKPRSNTIKRNNTPWIDYELTEIKKKRDNAYLIASKTKCANDWFEYKELRNLYQKQSRLKLISFFSKKSINDFNNTNKFWKFYKNYIKTKSDSSSNNIDCITLDNVKYTDDKDISEIFNMFFTTISSNSKSSKPECIRFIYHHFKNMKQNIKSFNNSTAFSFNKVNEDDVLHYLKQISPDSSPGISNIPTKVILGAKLKLIPVLTSLFNQCMSSASIPNEWKCAVVTPLYKQKGDATDPNNYRGISIIPPTAKLFEKIIAKQISDYFENNCIFYSGQHGFRKGMSCESALHEILSKINENQSKRLVNLLLFNDFRKAFDTVDADLLIFKLFQYGFDNHSLGLIKNYFNDRHQIVKIRNQTYSSQADIALGVPQGSILGPLFFLIFINDLAYYITLIIIKLFADDTTFIIAEYDIASCISKFKKAVLLLVEWCDHNRLDINWTKTFALLHNIKDADKVDKIVVNDNITITVVDKFKLLGVTIDEKLNFEQHVSELALKINRKLHSIKRLFYLSTNVKLQFFKTFILPYFDYCLSLAIYYSKDALQKLCNLYYKVLIKLFKFQIDNMEVDWLNAYLKRFNLFSFQHRLFYRLSLFSFTSKIKNNLRLNSDRNINYNLRNKNFFTTTSTELNIGKKTAEYFFSRFLNGLYVNQLQVKFISFKTYVLNNLSIFYDHFIFLFPQFDLKIKIFLTKDVSKKIKL